MAGEVGGPFSSAQAGTPLCTALTSLVGEIERTDGGRQSKEPIAIKETSARQVSSKMNKAKQPKHKQDHDPSPKSCKTQPKESKEKNPLSQANEYPPIVLIHLTLLPGKPSRARANKAALPHSPGMGGPLSYFCAPNSSSDASRMSYSSSVGYPSPSTDSASFHSSSSWQSSYSSSSPS